MTKPAFFERAWFLRCSDIVLETGAVLELIENVFADEQTVGACNAGDPAARCQVAFAFGRFREVSEKFDRIGPSPERLFGFASCLRRALDCYVAATDAYDAATADPAIVDRHALDRVQRLIAQGNAALDEIDVDPAFVERASAGAAVSDNGG